jgi:hypothetical protein
VAACGSSSSSSSIVTGGSSNCSMQEPVFRKTLSYRSHLHITGQIHTCTGSPSAWGLPIISCCQMHLAVCR